MLSDIITISFNLHLKRSFSISILFSVKLSMLWTNRKRLYPNRQSKLTKMLKNSLGGNAYSCIVYSIQSVALCRPVPATVESATQRTEIGTSIHNAASNTDDVLHMSMQIDITELLLMEDVSVLLLVIFFRNISFASCSSCYASHSIFTV